LPQTSGRTCYSHDTEPVLITTHDTRVVKGGWWPTLNGKDILRGEKVRSSRRRSSLRSQDTGEGVGHERFRRACGSGDAVSP
jgi:hypothetical protein